MPCSDLPVARVECSCYCHTVKPHLCNLDIPHVYIQSAMLLHCARSGLDKNIASTTAPERAVLSVLSLGVALRTDESGASEAAETFIFLASIWLAFASHVVLFRLNPAWFRSRPNPHRHRQRHWQSASSLRTVSVIGQIGIGLKSAPQWRYSASE